MAEKKPAAARPATTHTPVTQTHAKNAEARHTAVRRSGALFGRENYKWMLIGLVVIVVGLLLMIGGKSEDPNVFNNREVYSFRRITLAPILILLGLGIEMFAIFRKPEAEKNK